MKANVLRKRKQVLKKLKNYQTDLQNPTPIRNTIIFYHYLLLILPIFNLYYYLDHTC